MGVLISEESEGGDSEEAALCGELEAFCKKEGLPLMSADELALMDGVSDEQREWLDGFSKRWEAWEEASIRQSQHKG